MSGGGARDGSDHGVERDAPEPAAGGAPPARGLYCKDEVSLVRLIHEARLPASEPGHAHQVLPLQIIRPPMTSRTTLDWPAS
jgi:hypothetical protein